jgi:hypothetical protein
VNVALLGNAIDLFADAAPGSAGPLVLTAGTLSLISRLATTEVPGNPVIDALLVTGSAGGAVQLGALVGGGTVAETATNANRIVTLGSYVATGGLSVADASALTVAGPVQAAGNVVLAAAGALSVPGSVAGADVMLVANGNLLNAGPGSAAAPAGLSISGAVTAAGTLSLFATQSIDAQGTLVANVLTGSAGLAQPGQGLAATDPVAWVHLDGSANSIATLGDFTSTDVLRLTDARPLTIPGSTISAPLVRLLVSDGITIQGGVFIVGGETGLPPRGGLATDPTDATYTDDSQRGLYLAFTGATGQVVQTGLTQLEPIGALPALLRIDLPLGTANKVNFDPRLGLDDGLFGRTAAVFLHLGDGRASGNINVGQLAVIYASLPPVQTRMTGTLLNAEGAVIGNQTAASQANIGMSDGQFLPSGIFQLNGCALTDTSCIMIGQHDSVPVQSPLRPIDFGNLLDPREDPDLLAPNVSDRDY